MSSFIIKTSIDLPAIFLDAHVRLTTGSSIMGGGTTYADEKNTLYEFYE